MNDRKLSSRTARIALLLAPLLLEGCGGGRLLLSPFRRVDPAVEWVFEAPWQFGSGPMGTWGMWGSADDAVVTDADEVIVLTNYGRYWGFIEPCNAFLLDLETGKVLGRAKGPIGTIGTWYYDGHTVYVDDHRVGHSGWCALDLDKGTTREGILGPKGTAQPSQDWSTFVRGRELKEDEARAATTRYRIGRGRELTLVGRTLGLAYADSTGRVRNQRLCWLTGLRPYGIFVIANDSRRLLVAMNRYLICIDMRTFAGTGGTNGDGV